MRLSVLILELSLIVISFRVNFGFLPLATQHKQVVNMLAEWRPRTILVAAHKTPRAVQG